MITLTRKNLKNEGKTESKRISIRDKLLVKGNPSNYSKIH